MEAETSEKLKKLAEAIQAVREASKDDTSKLSKVFGDLVGDLESRIKTDFETGQKSLSLLSAKQERLETSDLKQTNEITELQSTDRQFSASIETLKIQLSDVQARLNGSKIEQIKELSLEGMRQLVTQINDLLTGVGGRKQYLDILGIVDGFDFTRKAFAIIGTGGVASGIALWLGVSKPIDLAPQLNDQKALLERLSGEIARLKADTAKLEAKAEKLQDRIIDRQGAK